MQLPSVRGQLLSVPRSRRLAPAVIGTLHYLHQQISRSRRNTRDAPLAPDGAAVASLEELVPAQRSPPGKHSPVPEAALRQDQGNPLAPLALPRWKDMGRKLQFRL